MIANQYLKLNHNSLTENIILDGKSNLTPTNIINTLNNTVGLFPFEIKQSIRIIDLLVSLFRGFFIGTSNEKTESLYWISNSNIGGISMPEYIQKEVFDLYKDNVEKEIFGINSKLVSIESEIKNNLASKSDLNYTERIILEKIENAKKSIQVWIFGGVFAFIIQIILMFMFG